MSLNKCDNISNPAHLINVFMDTESDTLDFNSKPARWRALGYFNFYRLLLSGLFVLSASIGLLPAPLGGLDETLFMLISHVYFLTALFFSLFILRRRPRFNLQIAAHTLIDIVMLSLLMYASGGLGSGFGMLLVIAVAGGSILRTGKIAIFFAAIATLVVLGHEFYLQFFRFAEPINYVHAGLLGATFFLAAFIGIFLSVRVRKTQAFAERQTIAIGELARLNEHIIQRMQAGITVLDSKMNVVLVNDSARQLFRPAAQKTTDSNRLISDFLTEPVTEWLAGSGPQSRVLKPGNTDFELQLSFIRLKKRNDFQVLVFIEDIAVLRQRAQQLKLASLARLTASIAHEIRNPLGAINHAGQLLNEAPDLTAGDKRLVQIINDHSARVNTIIENVLSISRRAQAIPEKIEINAWLAAFRDELMTRFELDGADIETASAATALFIRADASQLWQIMWNLAENALRYSKRRPLLRLYAAAEPGSGRPYVDIIDRGTGISRDIIDNLFEPFFTTEAQGSGLGLYVARELCEANQAALSLLSSSEAGATFRITFIHMNKKMI